MTALIELYANNANSVLANSITSSTTTINLDPGTGVLFPQPVAGVSFFRMTITESTSPNSVIEIVYVIGRSTDQLTVIRGQEGTTAIAWSVNDLVANEVTKGMLEQFLQPYYGQDIGAANAYVVETQNASSAYYSGMMVSFITLNANSTSTPTLNVNGLGTRIITNTDGTGLLAGQIPANVVVNCCYNANLSRWELQSLNGVSVTPSLGDNSTKYATTAFVQNALSAYLPAGTNVLFYQAAAPTGWSQLTTVNDAAIRIVSGVGGGAAGGNNFSTTFVAQAVSGSVSISSITGTVGGTALTTTQIPTHSHSASVTDPGHSHGVNDPTHAHGVYDPGHHHGAPWGESYNGPFGIYAGPGYNGANSSDNNNYLWNTSTNGTNIGVYGAATGISLNATTTGVGVSIGNTGSGGTHTHSLTMNPASGTFTGSPIPMNVKYIDVIICSKN